MTSGEFTIFSLLPVAHSMIFSFRENVEPLICHVSNAQFKGFSTYDKAEEFYCDAKQKTRLELSGTLEMIRNMVLLFCSLVLIQ